MEHPFLKNIRAIFLYFGVWGFLTGLHTLFLIIYYRMNFIPSFADALVSYFVMSMAGVFLWYAVRYYQPQKSKIFNLLINNTTLMVITLLVYTGLPVALMRIFITDSYYLAFIDTSFPYRIISGSLFFLVIILIYYLTINHRSFQEKLQLEGKLNERVKEAELNHLKSQINPHFIFNSLNSVSSLTMSNPEKAQEMIIKLSDYLRYSISGNSGQMVSLKTEMENIHRYLDIETIRFGKKLQYTNEIDNDCLGVFIPSMILQPLYENAVKHGVYESTTPIQIITKCCTENNFLNFTISNNFDPEALPRKGAGLGLRNIKDRLKLIYKLENLMTTNVVQNTFTVTLKIPVNKNEQ